MYFQVLPYPLPKSSINDSALAVKSSIVLRSESVKHACCTLNLGACGFDWSNLEQDPPGAFLSNAEHSLGICAAGHFIESALAQGWLEHVGAVSGLSSSSNI